MKIAKSTKDAARITHNHTRRVLIKTALMQRHLTTKDMAKRLRCTAPMLSMVISGRKRSRRIEMHLCRALGFVRSQLWGDA